MNDEMAEQTFQAWMEMLDQHLNGLGVQLSNRPLKAAILFVEHAVLEVAGNTKEDYYEKMWFGGVVRQITAWYSEKYGEAFEQDGRDCIGGIAIAYGRAFKIDVPRIVTKVEEPEETAWLYFAAEVFPQEDPLAWVSSPPNLSAMDESLKTELTLQICETASALRRTWLSIISAEFKKDSVARKAISIMGHLENAASDIFVSQSKGILLAVPEMCLAVEKSFKTLLLQSGEKAKGGHNLIALAGRIEDKCGLEIDKVLIKTLPPHSQVNKLKYGEAVPLDANEAFAIYKSALRITDQVTSALKRRFTIYNAGLLIKKPVWTSLLDQ
jgi:hypothetical protein